MGRQFESGTLLMNKEKLNERKRREYHNRKRNNCIECGHLTTNRFCNSKCQNKYNEKLIFQKIENGVENFGCQLTNSRYFKRYLIDKHGEKCMECGWDKRNSITNKVPIELEHIDGNSENNLLTNLKLLCPNCHSLTPTFKGLNRGNGRHKRMERYKQGKSF